MLGAYTWKTGGYTSIPLAHVENVNGSFSSFNKYDTVNETKKKIQSYYEQDILNRLRGVKISEFYNFLDAMTKGPTDVKKDYAEGLWDSLGLATPQSGGLTKKNVGGWGNKISWGGISENESPADFIGKMDNLVQTLKKHPDYKDMIQQFGNISNTEILANIGNKLLKSEEYSRDMTILAKDFLNLSEGLGQTILLSKQGLIDSMKDLSAIKIKNSNLYNKISGSLPKISGVVEGEYEETKSLVYALQKNENKIIENGDKIFAASGGKVVPKSIRQKNLGAALNKQGQQDKVDNCITLEFDQSAGEDSQTIRIGMDITISNKFYTSEGYFPKVHSFQNSASYGELFGLPEFSNAWIYWQNRLGAYLEGGKYAKWTGQASKDWQKLYKSMAWWVRYSTLMGGDSHAADLIVVNGTIVQALQTLLNFSKLTAIATGTGFKFKSDSRGFEGGDKFQVGKEYASYVYPGAKKANKQSPDLNIKYKNMINKLLQNRIYISLKATL